MRGSYLIPLLLPLSPILPSCLLLLFLFVLLASPSSFSQSFLFRFLLFRFLLLPSSSHYNRLHIVGNKINAEKNTTTSVDYAYLHKSSGLNSTVPEQHKKLT